MSCSKSPSNRADSPGYFTLSDSDGASNPGDKSTPPPPQNDPPQQVYKIFRSSNHIPNINDRKTVSAPQSCRNSPTKSEQSSRLSWRTPTPASGNKSKTPPRPTPPKNYNNNNNNSDDEDVLPPRPPPPLSYTSTLPPPVPRKKIKSKSPKPHQHYHNHANQVAKQKRNSAPVISSNISNNNNNNKSLQKPQPLQVQSPSVIKALTTDKNNSSAKNSKTKRDSPPRTFVQAFQRANNNNGKTRPQLLNNNNNKKSSTALTAKVSVRTNGVTATPSVGTDTPTKAITHKPTTSNLPDRKSIPRASQIPKRVAPTNNTKRPSITSKISIRSSDTTSNASKKSSISIGGKSPSPLPKKSPSPLQTARNFLTRKNATINSKEQKEALSRKNSISSQSSDMKPSSSTVSITLALKRNSPKLVKKFSSEKSLDSKTKKVSDSTKSADKSLSKTALDKLKAKRDSFRKRTLVKKQDAQQKASSEPPQGDDDGKEKEEERMQIAPVHDLIRYYETNGKDTPTTPMSSAAATPTSRLSGLTQLSQLGAAELLSECGNNASMRFLSVTEIDVLDQCVNDMMGSLSKDVATPRNSWTPSSQELVKLIKERENEDNSQMTIDESSSTVMPPPRSKKKHFILSTAPTPDPTEEDLSRGVFTEVSFAGSFVSQSLASSPAPSLVSTATVPPPPPTENSELSMKKPPIPSPRTKRKARKEQLLLEHKAMGKKTITDILKSRSSSSVPDKLSSSSGNSYRNGLDCLDDLCTMSRKVERDIYQRRHFENILHNNNEIVSDNKSGQGDVIQDLHERAFLGEDSDKVWGKIPRCQEEEAGQNDKEQKEVGVEKNKLIKNVKLF